MIDAEVDESDLDSAGALARELEAHGPRRLEPAVSLDRDGDVFVAVEHGGEALERLVARLLEGHFTVLETDLRREFGERLGQSDLLKGAEVLPQAPHRRHVPHGLAVFQSLAE